MSKVAVAANSAFRGLMHNDSRYLLIYGGAGSGKSVFAAQKIITRCMQEPGHRFLMVRNEHKYVKESVWEELMDVIQKMDIARYWRQHRGDLKMFCENGSQILTAGLDDVERLKSIKGISGTWIEEATELTGQKGMNDFDQLDIRMRGATPGAKQNILTFNPVDENHWIRERFFDNPPLGTSVHFSTFRDNPFIDAEYKQLLEDKAEARPGFGRVYLDGQWGKAEIELPWLSELTTEHISTAAEYRPELPVIVSFDFNIDPMVCTFHQIWKDRAGHHWHCFDEITEFKASVPGFVPKVRAKLEKLGPDVVRKILITGDATGAKRDINRIDHRSAWKTIQKGLRISDVRVRVPRSNPKVSDCRDLCNSILYSHPDVKINPRCSTTVYEMQYTEAGEDGSIPKKNRSRLDQRADGLDTWRYVPSAFMPDYIDNPRKYRNLGA